MTAAFQGNAFQPNAFQMGSDGAPAPSDQNSLISDGNETVMILHEQDWSRECAFEHQPNVIVPCVFPEIAASASTQNSSAATSHAANLPSGITSGDKLFLVYRTGTGGTVTTQPTGWNLIHTGASGLMYAIWKTADGSEGSTVTVTLNSSAVFHAVAHRISSGTHDQAQAITVSSEATGTSTSPNSPSFSPSFSGEKLFITAYGSQAITSLSSYPANCPLGQAVSGSSSRCATAAARSAASSFDPDAFTIGSSESWEAQTYAVKGLCEFPSTEPVPERCLDEQDFTDLSEYSYSIDAVREDAAPPEEPLYSHGLDTQDFTDATEYGWVISPPDDADEECLFPVVASVTAGSDLTTGTSHVVSFTASPGDGVLVVLATNGNTHTATAGWTEVVDNESVVSYWRIIDGTEGGTMTITSSASSESVWYVYRIQAGTFDPSTTPAASASLNSATQDPPNLSWGWTDKTLVLAAIAGDTATSPITFTSGPVELTSGFNGQETGGIALPDCYLAVGYGGFNGSSLNPSAFTITAQSSNYDLATIAIRGNCRVQQDLISLDEQDFTDLTDYGYEIEPLSEDSVVLEDPLLGDGQGLDAQDFTDLADYSYVVDQPIDDNNPEVAPDAIALDEQDFTDLADYGVYVEPAIPDNNPELAPSALDDQDFTDTSEYGFVQNAGDEQDHHLGTGDGLDQQDFTDLSDYGYSVDPLADDFVLREDFILGDGQGLDTQDFTDLSDYGVSVDQLSTDHVDFILGIALDDQDFTDLTDYGSTTEQAIPDNDQNFRPDMVALDDQDRTDFTDYGYVVDPLTPDLVEDFALGDGSGLDTQDFTDLADYGSYTAPLVDDFIAPEDFILGDGQGLDYQDRTDFTDYSYESWLTPENVTYVIVTGLEVTVQVGCFHAFGFGAIADGSTAWAAAPTNSSSWSQLANAGDPGWAVTSNGNTTWTGGSSAPGTDWEEDC